MNLKRPIRAGILLYALLMAALFTLILQLYLFRVVSTHRIHQKHQLANQSYIMATLVERQVSSGSGEIEFNCGTAKYQVIANQLLVNIISLSGDNFYYHFNLDVDHKKEETQIATHENEKAKVHE